MKKTLLTTCLALGVAAPAAAQDPFSVLATLDTTVANLHATSVTLVRADATGTAINLTNTINGLTTGLAAGTPAEPFAAAGVDLSNTLLTQAPILLDLLDAQAAPFADLTSPLADAYVDNTQILAEGLPLADGLIALGSADGGFQAFLVSAQIPVLSDLFGQFPAFPGFSGPVAGSGAGDALSLDALPLPLDAFDPATLLGLLGGGGGLPGLDSLPGGGAGGLPGLDALPLDALDPAILTGLLAGGLPIPQ